MNNLKLKFFQPFTATPVGDESAEFKDVSIDFFETVYPGGLSGAAQIRAERDLTRAWSLLQNYPYQVQISDGLKVLYEGWMQSYQRRRSDGGRSQIIFPLAGPWFQIAEKLSLTRYYGDRRVSDPPWIYSPAPADLEKFYVSRTSDAGDCLLITPARLALTNTDKATLNYTVEHGEKIKRVVFDYDLTSANDEDFTLELYDIENSASLWSVTRTTTGSSTGNDQTVTLTTTSNQIVFRLKSDASQTPAGGSYGEISDLRVFAETNNSGSYANWLTGIAIDLIGEFSDYINASTASISSAATTAIPGFITKEGESVASILLRAALFGDSSGNAYIPYFRESPFAYSPDGKPVLVLEAQPALTDYEYFVDLAGQPVELDQDFDQIYNWIPVTYTDANGRERLVTPLDDASLKDDDSISRWERRSPSSPLYAGRCTETAAIYYGVRYLYEYRYSKFYLTSPLPVTDYILSKGRVKVPVSHVRAGQRVRIKNFLSGIPNITDNRLTFLINRTKYVPAQKTNYLYAGRPGTFEGLLASF